MNKDENEIEKKIHEFIRDDLLNVSPADYTPETNLLMLGLDSLKIMRLVHFLEESFITSIPDQMMTPENLYSGNTVVALTKRCLSMAYLG